MTVESWLKQATGKLEAVGIGTARLDTLVLLEDELNISRAQVLAEPDRKLTNEQKKRLLSKVERRSSHEPLAYIRGHTEFYGRDFIVTPAVLEPRPESETMIELLKALTAPRRKMHIADVGAGCGAIGITASLESQSKVDLIEIDSQAIKVATKNVIKFATDNYVIKSDLLTNTGQKYDVLLCNLPYVPDNFQINKSAMREPRIAIFGGMDGLDVYRRLFAQIKSSDSKPHYIFTESLPPQHTKLTQIAKSAGYELIKVDDFIQLFENKL